MDNTITHSGKAGLSAGEQALLLHLRHRRKSHRELSSSVSPSVPVRAPMTRGQRVADRVAATVGSWRFILIQSALIAVWMGINLSLPQQAWDPYPFILLNLVLSFQAAYTAPAIMMSQNRQAEVDRQQAGHDYEINVKAELEIELLHEKIDLMRNQEIKALTDLVRDLTQQIETLKK